MSSSFTSIRLESIHGAGAVDRIFEKQVAIICEFPSEMAEPLRKKRLTLNLSFLSNLSESKLPIQDRDPRDCAKSTRNFERELVGLGIVAAMSDYVNGSADTEISVKISRTAILAVSPRSHPVPITDPASAKFARQSDLKFVGKPLSEKPNMKLSESYTCVISNIGNNLIKKREYFNDSIVGDKSCIFFASPPRHGKGYAPFAPPRSGDFLHSCHLCKKTLQGLDIFMYRGDKAFCSAECRAKQMASHEWAASDCSAFPCTGTPLQLLPEVAAA